jgi:hypothetical protein
MEFTNTDLGDTVGKLYDTIYVLATSPYAIKQRLNDAISGGFVYIMDNNLDKYPEIKAIYLSIDKRLSMANVDTGLYDASIDFYV